MSNVSNQNKLQTFVYLYFFSRQIKCLLFIFHLDQRYGIWIITKVKQHICFVVFLNFVKSKVKIREIMIFHLEQEILDVWISSQKMNTIYLFVQTLAILEFDFGFIFPWKIRNWINGVCNIAYYFLH